MHEYAPFAVTLLVILAGILLNRHDIEELRVEMKAEIGSVRTDLKGEIGSLRAEMSARLTKIQDDLNSFHRSLGQHDKAIEILE